MKRRPGGLRLLLAFAGAAPALGQVSHNEAAGPPPSFLQGQADRQAMEKWFAGLAGAYHAGAQFWASQRNSPNPATCYGPQGIDLGPFTAGCIAAQQRMGPIEARKKTDPQYRLGWDTAPPSQAAQTNGNRLPPPPQGNFYPNPQGVTFLKNLVDEDAKRAAGGQSAIFQYRPAPAPGSAAFDQTANQQIDSWLHEGRIPSFASGSAPAVTLFAFYWVGTQLTPGSPCLNTPRTDTCYLMILQKLQNITSNQDFVAVYDNAALFLKLPPLGK